MHLLFPVVFLLTTTIVNNYNYRYKRTNGNWDINQDGYRGGNRDGNQDGILNGNISYKFFYFQIVVLCLEKYLAILLTTTITILIIMKDYCLWQYK